MSEKNIIELKKIYNEITTCLCLYIGEKDGFHIPPLPEQIQKWRDDLLKVILLLE